MNADNWIRIASLVEDWLKTIIPFGLIFLALWLFRKEIKTRLKNGGLKVTGPGFSVESNQQRDSISKKERKEIETLNKELETTKQMQMKLQELQSYTARDKETFFLGYHFEKTYRVIFPSQMVILTAVDNHNGEMIDALARAIFDRTIWCQEVHIPFENFMGFLIQSGMISNDTINKKYLITPVGKTFIQYLKNNNIPLKLPPNDIVQVG